MDSERPNAGDGRAARGARNQSLLREVNERIAELNMRFSPGDPNAGPMVEVTQEWICECANESCLEQVQLPTDEYERVRTDGTRFIVAPAEQHVWPDIERVVEQNDDYWVVEKIGAAGAKAARLDPRDT